MKKLGGLIALIGGILGLFVAIVGLVLWHLELAHPHRDLFFGGFGLDSPVAFSHLASQDFDIKASLRWVGVFFTMATCVLAVICLIVERRLPAVLLIVCAATGAVVGVPLVKLFMVMALVGGVLAVSPRTRQPQYA